LPKNCNQLLSSEKVTSVNKVAVNGCNVAPHDPHDLDEELGQVAQRHPVPTFRPTVYFEVLASDRCTVRYGMPQSILRLVYGVVNRGIKA
jgi:hypothetical protein